MIFSFTSKRAFVAASPSVFGVARMWEIFTELSDMRLQLRLLENSQMRSPRPQYLYVPRMVRAAMFVPRTDMSWPSPPKTRPRHHLSWSASFVPSNPLFRPRNSREMKKTYALDFVTTPWQD